jgi:hypothetical protein
MSLLDSIASLGSQVIGNAIGGPIGGMIADKIMDFVVDIAEKVFSQAKDAVQQSDLPDFAKDLFDTAYDVGIGS